MVLEFLTKMGELSYLKNFPQSQPCGVDHLVSLKKIGGARPIR